MPKYGIHFIVLQEAIKKLEESPDPGIQSRGKLIRDNPYFANMGAIGPDLFFYLNDYDVIQNIEKILEALEPLTDFYENFIEPINDTIEAIEHNIEEAIPPLQVIVDLCESLTELKDSILTEGVICLDQLTVKLLTNPDDPHSVEGGEIRGAFQNFFEPPLNRGYEEQDWYWFDMLHYRKVGDFAFNLLENANDTQKMAYALAYLSHIATDVTGHPYVNEICRAPFRISAQRHVTAENFIDQWKWTRFFSANNSSGNSNPITNNIRVSLFSSLGFEEMEEMPDNLSELLADTLKATFKDVKHPLRRNTGNSNDFDILKKEGFPSKQDIKNAYRNMRTVLEKLGGNPDLRPIEPFDGAEEALNDLLDAIRNDPDFAPPPESNQAVSNGCTAEQIFNETGSCAQGFFENFEEWAESIGEFVAWAVDQIGKAAEWALNVIEHLGELTLEAVLLAVKLLIFLIQKLNYAIYLNINQMLSLQGIMYPEPEIANSDLLFIKSLINPHYGVKKCYCYPSMRQRDQSHLVMPYCVDKDLPDNLRNDSDFIDQFKVIDKLKNEGIDVECSEIKKIKILNCAELPHTRASFYTITGNTTPNSFISESEFDLQTLGSYTKSSSPEETRNLYRDLNKGFGNAIDFTHYLISRAPEVNPLANTDEFNQVFCNWNLDADRGYAYKEWEGIIPLCEPGDMLLALNFEKNDFLQLYPKIWQNANGFYGGEIGFNTYPADDGNSYAIESRQDHSFLSTLNTSEFSIPTDFIRLTERNDTLWQKLLPERLLPINGRNFRDNIYFINGLTTRPMSGVRANYMLYKAVKNSFIQDPNFSLNVRLLHNRSEGKIADDLFNDALFDYLYSFGYFFQEGGIPFFKTLVPAPGINAVPISVQNPTVISILAVLHTAFLSGQKIILAGHSQGAIQTCNAIFVFAHMSDPKKAFLRNNVKLLHMEPELIPQITTRLSNLVNKYLLYQDQNDVLMTLLSSQNFVDINNQEDIKRVRKLIFEMEHIWNSDLLSAFHFWGIVGISPAILDVLDFADLTVLKNKLIEFYNNNLSDSAPADFFDEALSRHWMPNQLEKIRSDIQNNSEVNGVNVRAFFNS